MTIKQIDGFQVNQDSKAVAGDVAQQYKPWAHSPAQAK
jgi:hypothetical protein